LVLEIKEQLMAPAQVMVVEVVEVLVVQET
jgi:hypothetical protein